MMMRVVWIGEVEGADSKWLMVEREYLQGGACEGHQDEPQFIPSVLVVHDAVHFRCCKV